MKNLNYLKALGIAIGSVIVLALIVSILYYFNILSSDILNFFKIIIPIVALLISSLFIGVNSKEKGYLEGIKNGLFFIITVFLLNLFFFRSSIDLRIIIYYLILVLSSMLGSMIGINFKSN